MSPLKRLTPLRRRTRLRARNPERRATEFARCYGSKARVAFVKEWPCIACGRLPSDNAHTATGGKGRKAGYETIVPLCRSHHRAYDEHRSPFDRAFVREFVQRFAARVESLWRAHQGGRQ